MVIGLKMRSVYQVAVITSLSSNKMDFDRNTVLSDQIKD